MPGAGGNSGTAHLHPAGARRLQDRRHRDRPAVDQQGAVQEPRLRSGDRHRADHADRAVCSTSSRCRTSPASPRSRSSSTYAKANPDKLTYSSVGPGSSQHLAGVLFEQLTGSKMRHLPYRVTGQLVTDLVTGEVPLSFQNITNVKEQAVAGNLKILAVAANAAPVGAAASADRGGSRAAGLRRPAPGSRWSRPRARRGRSSTSSTRRS